jgi:transketolase
MRTAFFRTLMELVQADPRVTLMVGDLGFGSVEPFAERFASQFVNAGVAEQNMTGVAAGMALSGRIVFTYSIANFPTLRCLEQIRNDVCYHSANVKVVAVGGGFVYGSLGSTHHATEDLAIMRALPNLTVVAPGDPGEAAAATAAVAAHPGPCYLRLGRAGEANVHNSPPHFVLGRAIQLTDGTDVSVISTGGMLETAARAAEMLTRDGISVRLLSMHTVKPIDLEAIVAAAHETDAVVTLEEHSITGGLGGAVAEVLAELGERRPLFRRLGLAPGFVGVAGTQDYLRERAGLDPQSVAAAVRQLLQQRTRG